MTDSDQPRRVRIDKWLWAARFYKTRSLAVDGIDSGKVQVNSERAKRAKLVGVGDEVRIRSGPFEHVVTVRGVSERRGSATIARALYEESPDSIKAREVMAAHVKAMQVSSSYEKGRPTKRERRQIDEFRGR